MFTNHCVLGHSDNEGSFKAELVSDKDMVKRDEFVTFTLRLSDINVEGGISVFVGTLVYDSNVLSLSSDMFAEEGWTLSYISESRKVTIDRRDPVTSDCDIAKFKFKVNYNAIASSTEVNLLHPSAGNSTVDDVVNISDIRKDISIDLGTEPTSSPTVSPTTSPTSEPTSSPTISPTMSPTTSPSVSPTVKPSVSPSVKPDGGNSDKVLPKDSTNNDSTTATGNLPKAGIGYVVPLMIFIGIIAVIAFRNYRNIDK